MFLKNSLGYVTKLTHKVPDPSNTEEYHYLYL